MNLSKIMNSSLKRKQKAIANALETVAKRTNNKVHPQPPTRPPPKQPNVTTGPPSTAKPSADSLSIFIAPVPTEVVVDKKGGNGKNRRKSPKSAEFTPLIDQLSAKRMAIYSFLYCGFLFPCFSIPAIILAMVKRNS